MPIFNDEITFIHIPKSGGTSITAFIQSLGWKLSLHDPAVNTRINGHSPQHSTLRELNNLNLLTRKVFAVVRPDVDRCISEFYYINRYMENPWDRCTRFDSFLDVFLDKANTHIFDYHNVPNRSFLIDETGEIDPRVELIDFFDIERIEKTLGATGLSSFHTFDSGSREGLKPTPEQRERIERYFQTFESQP
jgi:hypothetical protein